MRKIPMLKTALLPFLLIALLVGGCTNVQIDNASNASRKVIIDGKTHDLGPSDTQEIKLDAGQHTLQIKEVTGKVLVDTTFSVREGGLVNAGQTDYVNWRMLYGLQDERKTLLSEEWVVMDSVEYFGDFLLYGPADAYIEKAWDYGLGQSLPESKNLLILSDFSIESKLFRHPDFVTTYRAMSGAATTE